MSEEFKSIFDYAKTTDEQKLAVEEVIRVLEERSEQNLPLNFIINELKQNFKLEDVPVRPVNQSAWYTLTKDYNIGANIQGYRIITNPDGTKNKIPHVAFNADLQTLDDMITKVVSDVVAGINAVKTEQP